MVTREIIEILEQRSPRQAAEGWDLENVGLQVGDFEAPVSKIYLALDATEEAIEDAIEQEADMIVTHHPMIFGGVRKINTSNSLGRRILTLAKSGISYYAMHTNYDVYGMAQRAGEILDLTDVEVFFPTEIDESGKQQGIGRYGALKELMTLRELCEEVKKGFDIDTIKVFGELDRVVSTAAISPGSGKGMVETAFACGVDVLITGDIDHHTGIDAVADGLMVIDAGHYGIEHIFVDEVYEYLTEELNKQGELITLIKEPVRQPFTVL